MASRRGGALPKRPVAVAANSKTALKEKEKQKDNKDTISSPLPSSPQASRKSKSSSAAAKTPVAQKKKYELRSASKRRNSESDEENEMNVEKTPIADEEEELAMDDVEEEEGGEDDDNDSDYVDEDNANEQLDSDEDGEQQEEAKEEEDDDNDGDDKNGEEAEKEDSVASVEEDARETAMNGVSDSSASSSSSEDLKPAVASKSDNLEYDLGNLTGSDISPLDMSRLHEEGNDYLQELSRDNCQLLVNHLFALKTEPIDGQIGRLALLPEPTTRIPREKPLPKAKPLSKWQMFAQIKGITSRKRDRLTFDEERGGYAPRHGKGRAGRMDDQPIIEHNNKIEEGSDPWEQHRKDKKRRVEKNEKQHKLNLKAAAGKNRAPGAIDLAAAADSIHGAKKGHGGKQRHTEDNADKFRHVDVALSLAQHSTASLGNFDKRSREQPKLKVNNQRTNARPANGPASASPASAGSKRSTGPNPSGNGSLKSEKQSSLSVLKHVLGDDSGRKKESDLFNVNRAVANATGDGVPMKRKKGRK